MKMNKMGRFLSSSPNTYGVGNKSLFYHRTPPLSNCNPREQIQNIKELDDALNVFDNMSRMTPLPSVIQFTQLLSRVAKLKEYSTAIHLFNGVCDLGVSVDAKTMTIAINCYCLSSQVDYGFSILGSFFKRGCVPDVFTFSTLLKGLFRENKIHEAQGLFRKMVKEDLCALDVVTYGIVIDGLCKAGNTPMAIEMLRVIEKGRSSCMPNTHIYNMIIGGLCKDKMIDSALKLFDEMSEKEGITPDIFTYGTVIDGLCKAGNTPMAIEMLRVMEKGKGCKPDTHIYSMVIDSLCKDRMIDSALKLFDEMSDKGITPNVVTYGTVIDGLCKTGNTPMAIEMLRVMEKGRSSCKPNTHIYSMVIDSLCKDRMIDSALKLFDEMSEKAITPNVVTYGTVIDGLFKDRRTDSALKLFDEMSVNGITPNVIIYGTVIDGLCKSGNTLMAIEMLKVMEKRGSCKPDTHIYNMIIGGLCKDKMIDSALKLFDEMSVKEGIPPRRGVKPDVATFNTILKGLFRGGRDSCALKLFDEMQAVGLKPGFHTYCTVLDGLCRNGQVEQAVLFLDALERKNGKIHLHIEYYNIVMDGLCKAEKHDAARAIFRDLAAKGLKPDVVTYNIMIKGCCEDRLLMEAKELLLRMERDTGLLPNEVTYNSIIRGNLKWGKYEDAEKLFEQMCAEGFSLDAFTFELLLDLLGTAEQNPIIFKMIQKLAPNTLKRK